MERYLTSFDLIIPNVGAQAPKRRLGSELSNPASTRCHYFMDCGGGVKLVPCEGSALPLS